MNKRVFSFVLILSLLLGTSVRSQDRNRIATDRHGKKLELVVDDETHAIHGLGISDNLKDYGYSFDELTAETFDQFCRKVVDRYSKSFGISSADLVFWKIMKAEVATGETRWQAFYSQHFKGVQVAGCFVNINVRPSGEIPFINTKIYPDVNSPVVPILDKEEALTNARRYLDETGKEKVVSEPILVILPTSEETSISYDLYWQIVMKTDTPEEGFNVCFVSALDGKVISNFVPKHGIHLESGRTLHR